MLRAALTAWQAHVQLVSTGTWLLSCRLAALQAHVFAAWRHTAATKQQARLIVDQHVQMRRSLVAAGVLRAWASCAWHDRQLRNAAEALHCKALQQTCGQVHHCD